MPIQAKPGKIDVGTWTWIILFSDVNHQCSFPVHRQVRQWLECAPIFICFARHGHSKSRHIPVNVIKEPRTTSPICRNAKSNLVLALCSRNAVRRRVHRVSSAITCVFAFIIPTSIATEPVPPRSIQMRVTAISSCASHIERMVAAPTIYIDALYMKMYPS